MDLCFRAAALTPDQAELVSCSGSSSARTTNTAQGAWRTTESETLPISARLTEPSPRLPTATNPTPNSWLNRTTSSSGRPVLKCAPATFPPPARELRLVDAAALRLKILAYRPSHSLRVKGRALLLCRIRTLGLTLLLRSTSAQTHSREDYDRGSKASDREGVLAGCGYHSIIYLSDASA